MTMTSNSFNRSAALDARVAERKKWAWITLIAAFFVFFLKLMAWQVTSSQAILSDCIESLINIVAGVLAVLSVTVGARPPDRSHPYGHGKIESFTAGYEGGAILVAGIVIMVEGLRGFLSVTRPEQLDWGIAMIGGASAINGVLGLIMLKKGRTASSEALLANGKHLLSDLWTSVGVIGGLVLVLVTDLYWIDSATAFLVGAGITWAGLRVVRSSAGTLMDEADLGLLARLGDLLTEQRFPGIIRIHHTRVIQAGDFHHIDSHVVIPEFWTVDEAHEKVDRFEARVVAKYEHRGEVHFHLDPCRRAYCHACDFEPCNIRRSPCKETISFSVEELVSPDEPAEFLED